ncbi:MAG: hypothetical protein CMG60_03620 [Candidatus Marinimicrobia bacterium]|nr:hypothetical protein [Candidatus Neomarinimicrobiota bacterium]
MNFWISLLMFSINFLYSQDSLFWFDMKTVRDLKPNTPAVIDRIFKTSQLQLLDSIKNLKIKTKDGFRLQLFESSQAGEAKNKIKKFDKLLNDSLYLVFDAPLYKIRYGNFISKDKAEIVQAKLKRKGFKKVWIVKSRIEQ